MPAGFEEGVRPPESDDLDALWIARAIIRDPSREVAKQRATAAACRKLAESSRVHIKSYVASLSIETLTDRGYNAREEFYSKLDARTERELQGLIPRVCEAGAEGDGFVAWAEVACADGVLFPEKLLFAAIESKASADELMDLARKYEIEKQLDLAEQALKRACETHPADARPHLRLGKLHEDRENERAAVACYETAAAIGKGTTEGLAAAHRLNAIRNRVPTMDAIAQQVADLGRKLEQGSQLSVNPVRVDDGVSLRWRELDGVRLLFTRLDRDVTLYLQRPEPKAADPERGWHIVPFPSGGMRTTYVIWALPAGAPVWSELGPVRDRSFPRQEAGAEADRLLLNDLVQRLRAAGPATRVVELP